MAERQVHLRADGRRHEPADRPVIRATIPAPVFWITGLSGAGKTTVAELLRARLVAAGAPTVLLDGDRMRRVLGAETRHAPEDRRWLAGVYGRLCAELSGQGLHVVCATICMFREVYAWNRANIAGYREIFLRVPLHERQRRDPKRLYAAARDGQAGPMPGLDTRHDEPTAADLVIDNHGACSAESAADLIWRRLAVPVAATG
ncbi:MAG: adenylyl-sulfate kinase [Alphaproteobacteria bacterium]|nr:adenylyl-sulfate kinase [Alphaproteobacteria bacterium]